MCVIASLDNPFAWRPVLKRKKSRCHYILGASASNIIYTTITQCMDSGIVGISRTNICVSHWPVSTFHRDEGNDICENFHLGPGQKDFGELLRVEMEQETG